MVLLSLNCKVVTITKKHGGTAPESGFKLDSNKTLFSTMSINLVRYPCSLTAPRLVTEGEAYQKQTPRNGASL